MKRYKSCMQDDDTPCLMCTSCHYNFDCHNVPIDMPPKLQNVSGYPEVFQNPSTRAKMIATEDFPTAEIRQLIADLRKTAARKTTQISARTDDITKAKIEAYAAAHNQSISQYLIDSAIIRGEKDIDKQ